jgi:two-component sensor histidine kinase
MYNASSLHGHKQTSCSPIRFPRLDSAAPSEPCLSEDRLLLREFSHRINNEFASAISAISHAAAQSTNREVRAALAAVEEHLHNYAVVHHVLQMPDHSVCIDGSAYLRQLCRAIGRSKLESRGIELVLVERPFQMSSERCWKLGLILSELITNSARHSFGESGGKIRIEILPSRTFVECCVCDDGMGDAGDRHRGRGLEIVERLTKGLDGAIDQRFGPQGTTSVLIVPLAPASDD